MQDARLRIAMFIDFDNIEIGVKNTLDATFDAGVVLEALKERGDVVSKTAYSDWQRAGGHSRGLTQHAIKMVQRNLTPGGDKNGADINLALDALEMAFTHPHINAFAIVGGDSDFISLVEKLKQYDKKVFIVGGRQFTSGILQRNCNEFIAYENLIGAATTTTATTPAGRRQQAGRPVRGVERAPIEQAIPLVQRALEVMTEREVSPQIGLLKSTLLQLDSTFSERNYGPGSFRDFVDRLAQLGIVKLTQAKGGWLVGPAENGAAEAAPLMDSAPSASPTNGRPSHDAPQATPAAAPPSDSRRHGPPQQGQQPSPPPPTRGTPSDGLREFRNVLQRAEIRRWPMYLRNVKQILRQATPSFDERAFGFGSLVDLLRAAQKENLVRMERDRQGVIRVFQGTAPPGVPIEIDEDVTSSDDVEHVDVQPVPAAAEIVEPEVIEEGVIVSPESGDAAESEQAVEQEGADEEVPAAPPQKPSRARRPARPRREAAGAAPAAASTRTRRRRTTKGS